MTVTQTKVRTKMLAVARCLEQEAPAVTMTDERLVAVTERCVPSARNQALRAAVLAALPDPAGCGTQADYARAVREAVGR